MERKKKPLKEIIHNRQYKLSELEYILTNKMKNFAHEYIIDWNARRAYLTAYPHVTKGSAGVRGHQLSKDPRVIQYLNYIKRDYEKICGVSKMRQIMEYTKIAYSSIAHLHDDWITLKDFNKLTEKQKEAIESIETKTEVIIANKEAVEVKYVKIKLYSKLDALDRINKLMGYNEPDQLDITNLNTGINSAKLTPEERQVLLQISRKHDYQQ